LGHRENDSIRQEELALRNKLAEIRKQKNITQKDLEASTGLAQQAISHFETGVGANFKTILRYAKGINCELTPQNKQPPMVQTIAAPAAFPLNANATGKSP